MPGGVALVLAAALAVSDPVPPTPVAVATARPLTIRVYQQDGYRRDLVADLQQSVSRVVDGTGLAVSLIDCQPERSCERRGTNDLVLLLARGRNPTPGVCGEAVVGEGRRPGRLMIVYGGCVASVTSELRSAAQLGRAAASLQFLTESDVLGPVVVHELVHLLLPSVPHGHGLMRAALGHADWNDEGPPRLDVRTVSQLTAVLAARGDDPTASPGR